MHENPGDTTDIDNLLPKLAEGGDRAISELLTVTNNRLRHLAQKKMAGFERVRSEAETDDILQEALLKLNRALHACPPQSSYEYLGLAALQIQRVLLDLARRVHDKESTKIDTDAATPDTDGIPTDDMVSFHEAVTLLPDPLQSVFRLHYYLGIKQDDIARQLQIDRTTVSRQIRKASLLIMQRLC